MEQPEFLDFDIVDNPNNIDLKTFEFNSADYNPYNSIAQPEFKLDTTPVSQDVDLPTFNLDKQPFKAKQFDPNLGLMGEFVDVATEEGIPFKITSGYRPNAVTKNGSASWHSKGLALDIVPSKGVTWTAFKNKIMSSPRLIQWMKDNDFGIIDETNQEMLAKTGGTGPHFHIGKDKLAVNTFKEWMDKSIYNTKFTEKDIPKFANTMKQIYGQVLDDLNLPKQNIDNLVMQDAFESAYGTSPRGNGFNLGGIKELNDKSKGTLWSDGNYYRNFDNLYDYAKYKVTLLNNRYNAISSPVENFISSLHDGTYKYSASKDNYESAFKGMTTLRSILNNG